MKEFNDNYSCLFEVTGITKENIGTWTHFPEIYEDIKEESKMTAV